MYICICNPFREKDVLNFMKSNKNKTKVSDVYKGCSGGKNPQCCTCLKKVKEMVASHTEASDIPVS